MERLNRFLISIQNFLSYEGCTSLHFEEEGTSYGKFGTTAFILGQIGGMHLMLWIISNILLILRYFQIISISFPWTWTIWQWSAYIFCLSSFHFLEFFVTALYQPSTLSYNSFLVNHSKSYTAAALFCWTEFWISSVIMGSYKRQVCISIIGFIMVITGQMLRTLAMYTCGQNFSHFLTYRTKMNHRLITEGIYSIFRHPSYVGWFYWSLGTQLLLCNPISFIGFTIVSWKFFRERIEFEEAVLHDTYGDGYINYVKKTWIGIPFINSNNLYTRTPIEDEDHDD